MAVEAQRAKGAVQLGGASATVDRPKGAVVVYQAPAVGSSKLVVFKRHRGH